MSAQTCVALLLVLLAGCWLLGRALRRARPVPDPCAGCAVKALAACGPCQTRPGERR